MVTVSTPTLFMGYDLRVTRAIDWTANEGFEVSASEWLALVEADPELTADPANGPFAVRYQATRWFDWYEGNVFTTDPDRTTVTKMLRIAQRLCAAIQGDNGESYDSASQWSGTVSNSPPTPTHGRRGLLQASSPQPG